jgi:hypothetical protein
MRTSEEITNEESQGSVDEQEELQPPKMPRPVVRFAVPARATAVKAIVREEEEEAGFKELLAGVAPGERKAVARHSPGENGSK